MYKKYILNPTYQQLEDSQLDLVVAATNSGVFMVESEAKELTEEIMVRSVSEGREGTAMMPWKSRLTSAEIRAVVSYIRLVLMGLKPQMNLD